MNNYCQVQHQNIENYQSFKRKSKSESTSTCNFQNQFLCLSTELIKSRQSRHDNMKAVVSSYENQLNLIYPRHRFYRKRKHNKSDEIRQEFVEAQSKCQQLCDKLTQLHNRKQTIKKAKDNPEVSSADMNRQNGDLSDIKENISRTTKQFEEEKTKYHAKANVIYQKCQQLEQERLDLCKETLIKFLGEMHPQNYAIEENTIYDHFLVDILSQPDLHNVECEDEDESETEADI